MYFVYKINFRAKVPRRRRYLPALEFCQELTSLPMANSSTEARTATDAIPISIRNQNNGNS